MSTIDWFMAGALVVAIVIVTAWPTSMSVTVRRIMRFDIGVIVIIYTMSSLTWRAWLQAPTSPGQFVQALGLVAFIVWLLVGFVRGYMFQLVRRSVYDVNRGVIRWPIVGFAVLWKHTSKYQGATNTGSLSIQTRGRERTQQRFGVVRDHYLSVTGWIWHRNGPHWENHIRIGAHRFRVEYNSLSDTSLGHRFALITPQSMSGFRITTTMPGAIGHATLADFCELREQLLLLKRETARRMSSGELWSTSSQQLLNVVVQQTRCIFVGGASIYYLHYLLPQDRVVNFGIITQKLHNPEMPGRYNGMDMVRAAIVATDKRIEEAVLRHYSVRVRDVQEGDLRTLDDIDNMPQRDRVRDGVTDRLKADGLLSYDQSGHVILTETGRAWLTRFRDSREDEGP